MSTDAGDTSSRLSDALADIFSGREETDSPAANAAIPGEPYVLPEIVPATVDVPGGEAPRLPDRTANVQPATAEYPAVGPTTAAAAPTAVTPTVSTIPAAVGAGGGVVVAQPAAVPPTAPTTGWGDHMPAAVEPAVPATGWGDHMAPARTQLRAPGRRPRVRRVTRVLRHIDPWSTFKIAIVFSAVAYVVCLTSGVLLWRVADSTGTLDNVERWFTQFGWETFELKGDEIFHNAWIMGLFGVVAATGAAVLLVTLFNLVSDIVGGIRMTVLEEEVVERTISSTRRYVVRRPGDVSGTTGAVAANWSADDLDADDDRVAADETRATEPVAEPAVGDDTDGEPVPSRETQSAAATADWSVD